MCVIGHSLCPRARLWLARAWVAADKVHGARKAGDCGQEVRVRGRAPRCLPRRVRPEQLHLELFITGPLYLLALFKGQDVHYVRLACGYPAARRRPRLLSQVIHKDGL